MTPCRLPPRPASLAGLALLMAACGAEAPSPDIVTSASPSPPPSLVPARQAVEGADVMKLLPEAMEAAAAERALGAGPGCSFAFTEAGKPVLVVRASADPAGLARGIVRIHGKLAELRSTQPATPERLRAGATLAAEGIRILVRPVPAEKERESGPREADLEIRLAEGLTRAWRGVYRCSEVGALQTN